MENKKAIYFIGVIVLIILGIFYFNNNNEVKTEVKTESKTEVQKTETKVEVENNTTETKADVNKTKVKDVKSKETNSSDSETVYKNTPENEGVNMVLNVPEKWSHLDYSKLGQPEEVSLDEHPVKFHYLDAETEKKILVFYLNKDFRDLVSKFYDDEVVREFYSSNINDNLDDNYEIVTSEDFFSDINNFIYVNEKNGRKEIDGTTMNNIISNFCSDGESVVPYQTGCLPDYDRLKDDNVLKNSLTREEYGKIKKYINEYANLRYCSYWNNCKYGTKNVFR